MGTLAPGPARGGIVPVYLVTADGARVLWQTRDEREGFACALAPTTDGVRCVPTDFGLIGYGDFADAACTVPAAMSLGGEENAPPTIRFAAVGGGPHGSGPLKIFAGGARLADTFHHAGGGCERRPGQPAVYAVGPEIPPARFVAGASSSQVGSRCGLRQTVDQVGGWSFPHAVGDPIHDVARCDFRPTTDGTVRCVPPSAWNFPEYADEACTKILMPHREDAFLALEDRTTCPARVRVYQRGEWHAGPVYRKRGNACVFDRDQPAGTSRTMTRSYPIEVAPDRFTATPIVLR